MEDNIEINEYVRTNTGIIDKIDRYILESNIYHCEKGMCIDKENKIGTHLKDIVKHSKNIIDLIMEGDFIKHKNNGYELTEEVWKTDVKKNIVIAIDGAEIQLKDIKTIVTKEQFNSIKYEI